MWDEVVSLLLFVLSLFIDVLKELMYVCLISIEKNCLVELIVECINDCMLVLYLINIVWFVGMLFYVDECVLILCLLFVELINNCFVFWLEELSLVMCIFDLCIGFVCIVIVFV